MKNSWVYSILLILIGIKNLYSQQLLYTLQTSKTSYFNNIIGENGSDNFLINNVNYDYSTSQITKNQILKINSSGILLDSLNFGVNFLFPGPIVTDNNFYYCYGTVVKKYGLNSTSYFSTLYKIDQNLHIVKQVVIDTSYNQYIYQNQTIIFNNCLYIGNFRDNTNNLYFYKLNFNLQKKDSAVFSGNNITAFAKHGDKLIISGTSFPFASSFGNDQVMEIDTSFNVNNRFNLDSLTTVNVGCSQKIGVSWPVSNLHSISKNKYIVIGCYPVVNSSSCNTKYQNIISVIKNNNQVLKTDIVGNPFKDNIITNSSSASNMRYNYIFTSAITDYSLSSSNPYPPQTNTTQILVYKIDTIGNIVWEKYLSDPNMYYNPYGVYATIDSGAVVCGIRYNLSNPAIPNSCEGFVMKLDKNGNQVFVGIKENNGFNTNYHKCYPNPATDLIQFEVPFLENYKLEIFNILGTKLYSNNQYSNLSKISINSFLDGTYIYQITSAKKTFTGKFIKE